MTSILLDSGGWLFPLLFLALLNAILFIRGALRLTQARREEGPRILHGIHAILFWGAVGAGLGFLGQSSGIYLALQAVAGATEVSPAACAEGLATSFSSTILGVAILLGSAVGWFLLAGWYRRVERTWGSGTSAGVS